MSFGAPEWIIVLVVGFLLFGANKMPDMARSFGSSIVEFKKSMKEAMKPEEVTSEEARR